MKRIARQVLVRLLALAAVVGLCAGCGTAGAQYGNARFDRQALDSMLAPIALYPDSLLSQVLMAATYPQEVEEAAHWSRARPGLTGDAAVRTSEGWDWDPSVRSLLAFPLVLDTMASHLRWTEDVGDAFLSQREEVMDAIQGLRRRAYETGSLRSNEAVRVVETPYGIVIEQMQPESVHVPYYDPRITFGTWWWPARPPVYWGPWPGYVAPPGRAQIVYWGPRIGISAGFFFGGFVWPRHEVRVVNVHPYYYPRRVVVEPVVVPGHPAPTIVQRPPAPGIWRHDPVRRSGHELRDPRRANERPAVVAPRPPGERREPPVSTQSRTVPTPGRATEPLMRPAEPAVKPAPGRPAQPSDGRSMERNHRGGDERSVVPAERRSEPRVSPPASAPQETRRAEPRVSPPASAPQEARRAEPRVSPPAAGPQETRRPERADRREDVRANQRPDREEGATRTPREGARGSDGAPPGSRSNDRARSGDDGPGRSR